MAAMVIRQPDELRLVLETFGHLDDIRWQDTGNYIPLNYSHADLTADEKLLTHWLCYIADRQTQFQRVWDVGGYVISDLVRAYTSERDLDVRSILDRYVREEDGRLSLECSLRDGGAGERDGRTGADHGAAD